MSLRSIFIGLLVFFAISVVQSQNHFLVDLENRSPDVTTMVVAYEGTPSIPFLANDVLGQEQSLMAMKGKTVLLWFWNNDCQKCISQIPALNQLKAKYPDNLEIVSFSDNSKEEVLSFTSTTKVDFPVIPSSKVLSEGPYGGDLGYPKFFLLDQKGMIKWVIPEVEMKNNFDTFNFFETLHVSLHQ